jgi:hypothetical protein
MIKYSLLLIVALVEIIKATFYTFFEFLWDFNCTVEHFEDALETIKYIKG